MRCIAFCWSIWGAAVCVGYACGHVCVQGVPLDVYPVNAISPQGMHILLTFDSINRMCLWALAGGLVVAIMITQCIFLPLGSLSGCLRLDSI